MSTVSVIVPVYNVEKYIERCINSILSQTFNDLEIILVNDGSTDQSGDIIDRYAKSYNNIIAIHQSNKGAAEARKVGTLAAKGEYISFVDSDDYINSNAIEMLYDRCIEHDLDIAFGVMQYESKSNLKSRLLLHQVTGILNKVEFQSYLLSLCCSCSLVATVSKRSIWTDSVFLPSHLLLPGEDALINLYLSHNVSRCGIFNDIIAYYYTHNPLSLTSTQHYFEQSLWALYFQELRKNLSQHNLLEMYEHSVRILEIDRLTFNVKKINKNDAWYKRVVNYDTSTFPMKHKISGILLKYPFWCCLFVSVNRKLKRVVMQCKR